MSEQDLSKFKTVWQERHRQSWSFYCPLCTTPRKLPSAPRPSARHFVQIGLTSLMITVVAWRWLEWKGIVSFIPLWICFEVLYRLRMRRAAHCDHCGFDPYLFLVDQDQAKAAVTEHWEQKGKKKVP